MQRIFHPAVIKAQPGFSVRLDLHHRQLAGIQPVFLAGFAFLTDRDQFRDPLTLTRLLSRGKLNFVTSRRIPRRRPF